MNSEVPSTTRILAQIDMRNQIREDQSIGRTDETFPNINAITSHLLGILQVTTDPILKDYKRWIDIAGKEAIHRTITECIEPEISGLQGKHVSHATLEETRQHQSQTYPHFEGSGGYLDYLTGTRDDTCCRCYVGQSGDLPFRIQHHVRAIQRRGAESLHYYICFLGGNHRQPNFIRLFKIGTNSPYHAIQDKHQKALMLNILEMILALAFRSLPEELMSRYSTADIVSLQHSSIHLNVLNPLYQGALQHDVVRFNARQAVRNSADQEIRSWPTFRARYQADLPKMDFCPPSEKDYQSAFTASVRQRYPSLAEPDNWYNIGVTKEADSCFNLIEQVDDWKKKFQNMIGRDFSFEEPIGTLSGKIAIVFGHSDLNRSHSGPFEDASTLPFKLQHTGLTATNSLIWSVDLGASSSLQPPKSPIKQRLHDNIARFTLATLEAAAASVVLVSGNLAQQYITLPTNNNLSDPMHFVLRGQRTNFKLQMQNNSIKRLYIDVPDLSAVAYRSNWRVCLSMSRALRLASMILGMDIKHRYYEISSAKTQVFLALNAEKQGLRMEISMLGDFIKSWLWRRGFQNDEEIQELVNASGTSLSRALYLLYYVLRRQVPYHGSRIIQRGANSTTNIRQYTVKIMDAVERLVDEKCKKHWGVSLAGSQTGNTEERDVDSIRELYEDADDCDHDTKEGSWYPATDIRELEDDDLFDEEIPNNPSLLESRRLRADLARKALCDERTPVEDDDLFDEETQNNPSLLKSRRLRADLARKALWDERTPRLLELDDIGAIFEDMIAEFSGFTPDSLRKLLSSKGYKKKSSARHNKVPCGDERIRCMITGGVVLETREIGIGGQILYWNLVKANLPNKKLEAGRPLRVWIELGQGGRIRDHAWCRDTSKPRLGTFAFKVGEPHHTIGDAEYFMPKYHSGLCKDPENVRQLQINLAATIVRLGST